MNEVTSSMVNNVARKLAALDHVDDWSGRGDFDELDEWEQKCALDVAQELLSTAKEVEFANPDVTKDMSGKDIEATEEISCLREELEEEKLRINLVRKHLINITGRALTSEEAAVLLILEDPR